MQSQHQHRIIFVAHGDHNFHRLSCVKVQEDKKWYGHMDNMLGVYTVMSAYFSGRLPRSASIQITYGEEQSTYDPQLQRFVSFIGAREVMKQITQDDLIVVVDVTSMPEKYQGLHFSIQKCKNPVLKDMVLDIFGKEKEKEGGFKFQVFEDTPDTEACQDETDAFRQITNNVFFFGVQVSGGDYNAGPVYASIQSQKMAVEAMVKLAQVFHQKWPEYLSRMPDSPKKKAQKELKSLMQELNTAYANGQDQEEEFLEIKRKLRISRIPIICDLVAQQYDTVSTMSVLIEKVRKCRQLAELSDNTESQISQMSVVLRLKNLKISVEGNLESVSEQVAYESVRVLQGDEPWVLMRLKQHKFQDVFLIVNS